MGEETLFDIDKDGLKYMRCPLLGAKYLFIDKRPYNPDRYYQSGFYAIDGSDDYIMKYSYTVYTRVQIKKIKEMLINLVNRQKNVTKTDFPIGYCLNNKDKLCGQIVPFYQNGKSLNDVMNKCDLSFLNNFYLHDDNKDHNLFELFRDILSSIEEMVDNGIFYTDINNGNIILYNNMVKIIDFDYLYVAFNKEGLEKDNNIKVLLFNFFMSLSEALRRFYPDSSLSSLECANFEEAKRYIKRIENEIVRGKNGI